MKKIRLLLLAVAALGLTASWSCNDTADRAKEKANDAAVVEKEAEVSNIDNTNSAKNDDVKKAAKSENLGVEYTAKYICPNHCKGSGSDKEGECNNPDCGMELMENPNYKDK